MRASSSINWRVYGTRDRQIKRLRLCQDGVTLVVV